MRNGTWPTPSWRAQHVVDHRKLNKGEMRARERLEGLTSFQEFLSFDHVFLAVFQLCSRSSFRFVQYCLDLIYFTSLKRDHNRMIILRAGLFNALSERGGAGGAV